MDKLGRVYELIVGTSEVGNDITIALPFTIEFDITRNTMSSVSVCQVRIYNLSQKHRDAFRYNCTNLGEYRPIILKAGYGDKPPTIFSGNISQAWSVREGVNYITQIECYTGGFAFVNGVTSASFTATPGLTQRDVIKKLMGDLPKTTVGAVGSYPTPVTKGTSYNGNTAQILTDLTGNGFYLDNGKAYALGTNEYIADIDGTTIITPSSGLLATPVLEQTIVRFDMVFEPGLNPGQKVNLASFTERGFNRDYIVKGVKHRGTISEVVCGSVITSGEFFYEQVLAPASA